MTARGLHIHSLGSVGDLDGPRSLLVEDGRIRAFDTPVAHDADLRIVDASGLVAVPGFIDLQLNGAFGNDFTTRPDSMWTVGTDLARSGVTAFLATIITSPRGSVDAALAAFRDPPELRPPGAVPLGLHVEGPYLSPVRRGAHPPDLLRDPDLEEIRAWVAGPGLRMLTLAPERAGAMDAIALLAAAGTVVSVGHTDADATVTRGAIDAGARSATHLFNAMPPLGHRAPGAAGALLVDDRVTLGLILDGHHLDPAVVELVDRAAPERILLVSDAIAALGLPDGEHRLASHLVTVLGGAPRLPDGTLAGAAAGLDACVRAFASITGSPRRAVRAATETPARLLGLAERGRLVVGGPADIVLIDQELHVGATMIGGDVVFAAEADRWA